MDLKPEAHPRQPITTNGSIDGDDSLDADAAIESEGAISDLQSPSPPDAEKVSRILVACRQNDLDSLAGLATSPGGLVEDEIRRTACKFPFPASRELLHTRTCRICDS